VTRIGELLDIVDTDPGFDLEEPADAPDAPGS
jgi:hypothetical protein